MSLFFRPHELYDDVTLNDVSPPFHLPMYPTDGESDFDTRLVPTYSVKSDSLEPLYPYVIRLTSDSSSSSVGLVLTSGRTQAMPRRCGHA